MYARIRHSVFYVETPELIAPETALMEACHRIRRKAYCYQIRQLGRLIPGLQQVFQNLIVSGQAVHDLSPVRPAALCKIVIMPALALLTTEFLVRPAVYDPVPALQAHRLVLIILYVFHTRMFYYPAVTFRHDKYPQVLLTVKYPIDEISFF